MAESKKERTSSPTSGLFRKYKAIIITIVLSALIDIGVLGANFYSSFTLDENTVSTALAGRQRMLSQRVAKGIYELSKDFHNPARKTVHLNEVREVVNQFDSTLKAFQHGGTVTGSDGKPVYLKPVSTAEGQQIVADAQKVWAPYNQSIQPLLDQDATDPEIKVAQQYAETHNLTLLKSMDALSNELEETANETVTFLRWVQIIGMLAALTNFFYAIFMSIRGLIAKDRLVERARRETEEIMSTVKEGLFLLDPGYLVGSQHSASLTEILQKEIHDGDEFLPVLKSLVPPSIYTSAKDYIELLFGPRVKEALVLSLNPLSRVEVTFDDYKKTKKTRYLSFHFNRALVDGKISHLLVTVQDVTEHVHLQQQLEQAKDLVRLEIDALLRLLKGDPVRLQKFLSSVRVELGEINESLRVEESGPQARMNKVNLILRKLHGIKGEAAMLSVEMLETYAHRFEQELIEVRDIGEVSSADMLRIPVLLDGFYEQLSSIDQFIERFTVSQRMHRGVTVTPPPQEDSFSDKLQKLAQRIANDQQKKIQLVTDLDVLEKLPSPLAEEIQSIVVQLLRNAITHGIEVSTQRTDLTKSANGTVQVRCEKLADDRFRLVVRDDGNGIVLQDIRDKLASSENMDHDAVSKMGERELIGQLFRPGFSTAGSSDRDAGHGIGLDIVAAKVAKMRGGDLKLSSKPNEFTEFSISFSA